MSSLTIITRSAAETGNLGLRLGSILEPGIFISLRGELGGGKTCFTRGIVTGCASGSADLVASPSYAIMNEYPGPPPIYHFDFYRLACEGEIAELGFEEYFHGNGICIAEWPERLGSLLPRERIDITFEHAGDDRRQITFDATGPRPESVLAGFRNLNIMKEIL